MEREEAIEIIKNNWPDNGFTMLREALETIIPELKESEDERIRKWLIKDMGRRLSCWTSTEVTKEQVLAWLEKQGQDSPVPSNSSNIIESSWNEEDEKISSAIIKRLKGSDALSVDLQKAICWIDYIKDRMQWKPSKDQMEALKSSTYCQNEQMSKALFELYQDLKKLKGE